VTAGRADPEMLSTVADAGAGFVAMHMHGVPRTMQQNPYYDDVVKEVGDFLVDRLHAARRAGIQDDALCADPGIGVGKRIVHNLTLLAHLDEVVQRVEVPLLVGTSRKTFIGWVTDTPEPAARDDGTLATVMWAIDHGASIVRVHAVRPAIDTVRLWHAM